MSKTSLVDCLKLFNRKERYWLLRNTLGKGSDLSLHLDNGFLLKILKAVKISVSPPPQDVWWAMDYHFDWIAGALRFYGEQKIGYREYREQFASGKSVISGTQEDIDFIISFGKNIILIEAKCAIAWDSEQFCNKRKRINALKEYINNNKNISSDINIEFLLISPKKPKRLKEDIIHIEMSIPDDVPKKIAVMGNDYSFLKTVRCDEDGNKMQSGKYWSIVGLKEITDKNT